MTFIIVIQLQSIQHLFSHSWPFMNVVYFAILVCAFSRQEQTIIRIPVMSFIQGHSTTSSLHAVPSNEALALSSLFSTHCALLFFIDNSITSRLQLQKYCKTNANEDLSSMKQMRGGACSRCAWTQMGRQTDSNVLTETNWDKVSVLYQSF